MAEHKKADADKGIKENTENKQKNTYREDEAYEDNFDIRHILLAGAT